MEIETTFNTTSSSSNMSSDDLKPNLVIKDQVRVKKKTLQTVLDHCQRALELLSNTPEILEDDDAASSPSDCEANELCDLIKSRLECVEFLEKLEQGQISNPQNFSEEGNSWDMVSENDLWEGEGVDSDKEDYVFVRQEDIVEGIACFMAAYLLSLKQTKDLTPNQLQDALSKTFSVKKKKGKLRKAWDGSKVLYNVASWGATAIGIYQNPVILRVASKALWTSCHVISKLL